MLAALIADQRGHEATREALDQHAGPRILSPFVLAEIDYLLLREGGPPAESRFLAEVERGAYELVSFDSHDIGRARGIIEQYQDLAIGLADASLVVLATRYGTDRILTLDERHFRTLSGPDGRPFTILPADA